MQLLPRLIDPGSIIAVDDEDETLCAGEVVPPEGTDFVLSADVPDVELDVFVGDGLDVEADGGDGGDVLIEF